MPLFRYRRCSVKTMLGVTKAKKRFNKATGITAIKRPFRAPEMQNNACSGKQDTTADL